MHVRRLEPQVVPVVDHSKEVQAGFVQKVNAGCSVIDRSPGSVAVNDIVPQSIERLSPFFVELIILPRIGAIGSAHLEQSISFLDW